MCLCVCYKTYLLQTFKSGATIKTKLYRHCVLTVVPGCDDKSAHSGSLGGVCSVRSATWAWPTNGLIVHVDVFNAHSRRKWHHLYLKQRCIFYSILFFYIAYCVCLYESITVGKLLYEVLKHKCRNVLALPPGQSYMSHQNLPGRFAFITRKNTCTYTVHVNT